MISETDEIPTEIVTGGNGFETNRAGDLVYCMEWAKREAVKKGTVIRHANHPEKGSTFGVIDLMNVFGNYKTRKTATDQWLKYKRLRDTPNGSIQNHRFVVPIQHKGRVMDHCTISDFFDKVLPHITGPVADAIKRARSNTATLVSTGSQKTCGNKPNNLQSKTDRFRSKSCHRVDWRRRTKNHPNTESFTKTYHLVQNCTVASRSKDTILISTFQHRRNFNLAISKSGSTERI